MDKDFALKLAADIGIDAQQVIREEAELILLKGLFESGLSDKIVFKGGTALRLIYASPRFSEDLDFSLLAKIEPAEFKKAVMQIVKSEERFSLKDLASKYYTHIAEIRVRELWQDAAFSVKLEISKRMVKENGVSYTASLAKSDVTNISVMVKAFTLEQMLKDKLCAIEERKTPRDIFDTWFICQRLNKPFTLKGLGYPKGRLRQELRKFLPKKFYPVIEELEKINA